MLFQSANVQPELEKEPWRTLKTGEEVVYLKCLFDEDKCCYSIIVTDLKCVWLASRTKSAFRRDKRMYNPHLDTPLLSVLQSIKHFFEEATSVLPDPKISIEVQRGGEHLTLSLETKIGFYIFNWKFVCALLDPAEALGFLRDSFVLPLVAVANELNTQLDHAKEIIVRKEMEIARHKSQGSSVPKKMESPIYDHASYESVRMWSSEFILACQYPVVRFFGNIGSLYKKYEEGKNADPKEVRLLPKVQDQKEKEQGSPCQVKLRAKSPDPLAPLSTRKARQQARKLKPQYSVVDKEYAESPEEKARRERIRQKMEQRQTKKQRAKKKIRFV